MYNNSNHQPIMRTFLSYPEWRSCVRQRITSVNASYDNPAFIDRIASFCWNSFLDEDCPSLEASLDSFFCDRMLETEYETFLTHSQH